MFQEMKVCLLYNDCVPVSGNGLVGPDGRRSKCKGGRVRGPNVFPLRHPQWVLQVSRSQLAGPCRFSAQEAKEDVVLILEYHGTRM